MKKRTPKLFSLLLSVILVFALSVGISATETEDFYANEEAEQSDNATEIIGGISLLSNTDGNLVIVLDPGHGATDPGAAAVDGSRESDLNLAVARYCKAYLEQYEHITVYLTHEEAYGSGASKIELSTRAAKAAAYSGDLLISIHFNSATSNSARGAEAYVSCLEEYKLTDLANAIVSNLGNLGLKEIGVKTRVSASGDLWSDNTRLADYYGIIRGSCKQEIPSMIVEHCFINNSEDYYGFADSESKLKALGEADAKAIIAYFGLDKEPTATTLENTRYTALQKLDEQYNSMNLNNYDSAHRTKIPQIYADAKARINAANNIGKIELTVNRAVKTLANYPKSSSAFSFSDVKSNDWFAEAVYYCHDEGLFHGTSDTEFSPLESITRGQFIAVLGRFEGVEETTPTQTKFSDVNANEYYAPHIKWASDENIVAGMTDTLYAPEDFIRREDLVRMLHNYCVEKDIELPVTSTKALTDFKDGDKVDDWAIDAMTWAISVGIINGDEKGLLNPQDDTLRAEVAQIMMNFDKAIAAAENAEAATE